MAKKKKSSKKKGSKKSAKKQDKKPEGAESSALPEGFSSQVATLVVILLAVLMLVGAFGTGGDVAIQLFDWASWLVGYFAYFLPFILVFGAVNRQRSDAKRLPFSLLFGIGALVASATGFLHLFVEGDTAEVSLRAANDGVGGGIIGHISSQAILSLFNTWTGGIVLIAVAVISVHFILKLPLTRILRIFHIDRKKKKSSDEADDSSISSNEDSSGGFKLNEGVPIQRSSRKVSNKASEAAAALSETHDALTTSSDPEWEFPNIDLLEKKRGGADAGDVEANAEIIRSVLADFNIDVEMTGANVGPRVTQYTLKPPSGVKLSRITALEDNIALALGAPSIRMEAPIPGQRAVGVEVPNITAAMVGLRGMLEDSGWKKQKSPLSFAVGRDISGRTVYGALDKMPHLIIAGATGTGKSVMINTLLTSLLYRNSPSDMKLILIDPKQVELAKYKGMPHLLTEVITDVDKSVSALKWSVAEMERRYTALAEENHVNIADYNRAKKSEGMPYIVIVIDELAELMLVASRDVETLISRLTAKARAVGIHLVLATQTPRVNIITGVIKNNVPARMAFTVPSQIDSRTIIDSVGSEKLLSNGDMLFKTADSLQVRRVQGALIEGREIDKVTNFLRDQRAPQFDDEIVSQPVQLGGRGSTIPSDDVDTEDSLYMDAIRVVVESKKASASLLQRRLRVGYSRAARLIETMEEQGIIGPADGARPREVLIASMADLDGEAEDDFSDV